MAISAAWLPMIISTKRAWSGEEGRPPTVARSNPHSAESALSVFASDCRRVAGMAWCCWPGAWATDHAGACIRTCFATGAGGC